MLLLRVRSPGAVTQRLVRARTTTTTTTRRTAIFVGISRIDPNGNKGVGSSLATSRIFSSSSSSRIVENLDGVAQKRQQPPSPAKEARHSHNNTHILVGSASGTRTPPPFSSYARNAAALALTALMGFGMGRWSVAATTKHPVLLETPTTILPNGLPRTCCEQQQSDNNEKESNDTSLLSSALTDSQQDLLRRYRRLVGNEHVLDCTVSPPQATAPYLVGARIGGTDDDVAPTTLCVVTPTQLHHVADIVEWAIQADCVVLVQGQNTGLTGGSVPHTKAKTSSRPIVVLSMKQLKGMIPLDDGQRVVCMAGVGLASVRTCWRACVYYLMFVMLCISHV